MKQDTPLVSVIIPTYNRAGILKNAIDSALAQTYPNIQLIVVDDGSTDETDELLKTYPQVEYIKQMHGGQAAARNRGLKHAKGSIVASHDSDDLWLPDFLERSVAKLEEDKCDFVFSNWFQCDENGVEWDFLDHDQHIKKLHKQTPDNWVTLSYAEARNLYILDCPSPSSSVVMRKSSIAGEWDDTINIGDDWCMYLNIILSKECRIAFTMDKLWKKRVDSHNIYDGRKRADVLKYLFIADTKRFMEKFAHLLTRREMRVLRRRYIGGLEELAKHKTLRENNLQEAVKLFKTAFSLNVMDTLIMIPVTIINLIERKLLFSMNKRLASK
jgi:glycosyltransferase involved in cell wall biosynthesis